MSRALTVLEDVQIASPCKMSWEDMTGTDRVRHCAACQLDVYNLSGMRRSEALALVQAREGRICVRFYRRADGTVLTTDCPIGVALVARKAKRAALAVAAASLGLALALLALLAASVLRPAKPLVGDELDAARQTLEVTKRTLDKRHSELIVPEKPARHLAGGVPAPRRTPPPVEFLGDAL